MSSFKRITNTSSRTLHMTVNYFFDRDEIKRRMNERERAAFMKIGAFMRKTMRRLMRPSTKGTPHSQTPDPPRTSVGLIRKMINFSYSPWSHSVVVGPELVPVSPTIKPVGKTVPQLLDEGGYAMAPEHYVLRDRQQNRLISLESNAAGKIRRTKAFKSQQGKRTARYHLMKMKAGPKRFKPRPFRKPTFDINLTQPKLQAAWSVIN